MIEFDEKKVLHFTNPFCDAKCDNPVVFRDKIVTTRTPHECNNCRKTIPPGDRARSLTDKVEGHVGTYYFCDKCCAAMIEVVYGEDDLAYMNRYEKHFVLGDG